MEEKKHIILRTYGSVWEFERKIYNFEGYKLLIPIKPSEAIYFLGSLIGMILITRILPVVTRIPWPLRLIFMPFGIMKFLTKQKLDGKLPHKFFWDLLVFQVSPKKFERMKAVGDEKKKIKFTSLMTCRPTVIINKTREILNTSKQSSKKGGEKQCTIFPLNILKKT